jgi:AcrR family transcriptional regulator
MIEAVGELGYARTPVAEVIARAGVSRKAFYEHFTNREECFLEASDLVARTAIDAIEVSYRDAKSTRHGTEAAIAALFQHAIANPQAARLVLVELGALGQAGVLRREQLIATGEQLLDAHLGLLAGGPSPNPVLRTLIGGLGEVLYTRASTRRPAISATLTAELMNWIAAYIPLPAKLAKLSSRPSRPSSSRGGRAPGTLAPAPDARHDSRDERASPHSFVAHNQRERILDAVANLSATKGYAGFKISNIRELAAISLDVFHQHFAGQEDAFLVTYEVGHGKSLAIVEAACWEAPDWPQGVRAGIAALLDFLSSEPAFAYLALIDAQVASSRTAARARAGLKAFEQLFIGGMEQAEEHASPLTIEAITGGLSELCIAYTLQGRSSELFSLAAPATYMALAPIIGRKAAAQIAAAPD